MRPVETVVLPGSPARSARSGRRLLAFAAGLALAGCASNPYTAISEKVRDPSTNKRVNEADALAGNLDLALSALADQRQKLWSAAGEIEQMKNLTAFSLLGLTSATAYRGLEETLNRKLVSKIGLTGAVMYGGAEYLQPDARQRVFVAGATALTCMALVVSPYEMTKTEFDATKAAIEMARQSLESAFTLLHTFPRRLDGQPDEHEIQGLRRKALFADRVLREASRALGTLERVGPNLRHMTAAHVDKTLEQVRVVGKDLSQILPALAALKINANSIIGTEVFKVPEADDDTKDSDKSPATKASASDSEKAGACQPLEEPKQDQKSSEPAKPPAGSASSPAADPNAKPQTEAAKSAQAAVRAAQGAASAAAQAASAATTAAKRAEQAASVAAAVSAATGRANQLGQARQALLNVSSGLAKALALLQRMEAAPRAVELPEACGTKARTIALSPNRSSIALTPGSSFQFLLNGDDGKPQAQFLTLVPSSDVLDVSTPLMQAAPAVRLSAGRDIKQQVETVVRIADSRNQVSFDVAVRVCKGKAQP